MKINNFIPQGVADTHCDEYEIKENMIKKIKNTFKGFGYRQFLTPTFEYYDLFVTAEGTINNDEMLKFIDSSGKILVLRPDMTIPLARMVATNYKDCSGYLKFSYATNIFRINDEQSGMKREFIQAGIEYLGSEKPDSDAEVISVAIETLKNCGITDFQIDLGQADYFKGLMKELGLTKNEQEKVRSLIENKNFTELPQVLARLDVPQNMKEVILQVPYLYGEPTKVLQKAEELVCNKEMEDALKNLSDVYNILKDYGYEKYLSIDLGLIHHINYYTGVIFKGYVNHYGKAVLSGGRYDNLAKQYGLYMPATGFGLNVDKLLEVMVKYEMEKDFTCTSHYLVLYDGQNRKRGFEMASQLRKLGYIVETDGYGGDLALHLLNAKYRNISQTILLEGEKGKIFDKYGHCIFEEDICVFMDRLYEKEILQSI